MKVIYNPYKREYSPLGPLMNKLGFEWSTIHRIHDWFARNIYNFRKDKIVVRLDRWDTWNVDYTLSIIILPLLKKFQKDKHGAPHVDDEDVPEAIRSFNAKKNKDGTDEWFFVRWDYVINEMIWAFEQTLAENEGRENYYVEEGNTGIKSKLDMDLYKAYNDRIANGLRLFGKYYRGLWW